MRMLPQNSLPLQIKRFESCDSTNRQLLEAAEAGTPGGWVYVAQQQWDGRGRRGRQWIASSGNSLTFSLLWVFPPDPARLQGLSLLIGLAIVQAIEGWLGSARLPGVSVGLKWPNDILIQRRDGSEAKAGGVLVESVMRRTPEGGRELAVVMGIGLNCVTDWALGERVRSQPVAAVSELYTEPVTPECFLPLLLDRLTFLLPRFQAHGFAPYANEWNAHHLWQGRPVEIREGASSVLQGRCDGVSQGGELRVVTTEGVEQVIAGDVSLRKV